MDVQDELRRQLEERRQVYLSTVQDSSTTRVQREEALGDLQLPEAKIAKLGKPRSTPDEHQFDLGGEA
jgi:hypothetical protein